jgi:hypothetical protein
MILQKWTLVLHTAILIAALPAGAQQVNERRSILKAAAEAIRERLPKGAIALDPRVVEQGQHFLKKDRVAHEAATQTDLQGVLRGRIARTEDIATCPTRLHRSCRIEDGVGVVAFGSPRIQGDTAELNVYTTYSTGLARIPIAREELRLVLVKKHAGWQVIETHVESRT